ncbi:MAG TPA: DUF4355 domain-containing protein [Clostridium sp.]
MAIENFSEVVDYITTNSENEEVSNYIKGFKTVDLDGAKNFLESNEEGKSYFDTRVGKGIETFKTNNLQKLIDAEMLKKNPALTPEQLQIQELKQKFADMEKSKTKVEQMSKYKDILQQKKIPSNMVDFLLNDDEETTNANIAIFEDSMKSYIEEAIKAKFGSNQHTPSDATAPITEKLTDEQINKMSQEQLVKYLNTKH